MTTQLTDDEAQAEVIWTCKIGGAGKLMEGADAPMRNAIANAFERVVGSEYNFLFSGWGGELTEFERAVVENREPAADRAKLAAPAQDDEALIADLRKALQELHDRCVLVKAALDKGIPTGEPVHPQSRSLTWPLATAAGALNRAHDAAKQASPEQAAEIEATWANRDAWREKAKEFQDVLQALSDALPSDEFMRAQGDVPGPLLVRMRAALARAAPVTPAAPPPEQAAQPVAAVCRTDGRCQYAIDHGAEGLGHCPKGKCAMPPPPPERT